MTTLALPVEAVTQDEINLWYSLQEQLAEIKDKEMTLRKKIFADKFRTPKEGTNTFPLTEGWVMKGNYKIDRKVELALYNAQAPEMRAKEIPVDKLIKWTPELNVPMYRQLTEEQRAIFDEVLTIKPGSPSLSIEKPKRQPT